MIFDQGSFRDPAGKIFYHNDKVYRLVTNTGLERIEFLKKNDLLEKCQKNEYLIQSRVLNNDEVKNIGLSEKEIIIEHSKIPYISYPYEWSFSQLKTAALHHLDFNLFLLNENAMLIDASAYNIQFIGSKPKFIDILSIREYQDGEYWYAHKQFCENFLNPLILSSLKGVQFNNWFKGNLEGVPTSDLNNILSFFDKFSYNIFVHVYLLNRFDNKYKSQDKKIDINIKKKFPKKNLIAILTQLKNFISKLEPKKITTVWENYSVTNTYEDEEEKLKASIVERFIKDNELPKILDLGCNDGFYSKIAINDKKNYVVGMDFDPISIDRAYNFFNKKQENFLPLIFDATNPSANIGWNESERKSFKNRASFDGLLALAFEHHLAIAKNIPLESVLQWLISIAPKGLIEFVPKNDTTIKKMLHFKGDIFPEYSEENFEKKILNFAKIVRVDQVTKEGRKIYQYER